MKPVCVGGYTGGGAMSVWGTLAGGYVCGGYTGRGLCVWGVHWRGGYECVGGTLAGGLCVGRLTYFKSLGSVEKVGEVKIHNIVASDYIRIHFLYKVTPLLCVWACVCVGVCVGNKIVCSTHTLSILPSCFLSKDMTSLPTMEAQLSRVNTFLMKGSFSP